MSRRTKGGVTLTSEKPALYVTHDHGGSDVWSDKWIHAAPGGSQKVPEAQTASSERRGGVTRRDPVS